MSELINQHLGFGCVALGSHKSLKSALNLLNHAFDSGLVYFDTAPIYSQGYSERILGNFIKNKRDGVIITTKFGLGIIKPSLLPVDIMLRVKYRLKGNKITPIQKNDLRPELQDVVFRKIDRSAVEINFIQSLKSLRTDYIDYYLLHEGLGDFLTEEALSYLIQLKKEGKIKKLGLATSYHNIKRENDYSIWDVLQYENNPYDTRSDDFTKQQPNKIHIYHTVLKGLSLMRTNDSISQSELGGMILLHEHRKNPSGRILFSTTSSAHLKENLKHMELANSLTDDELKEIFDYAIS